MLDPMPLTLLHQVARLDNDSDFMALTEWLEAQLRDMEKTLIHIRHDDPELPRKQGGAAMLESLLDQAKQARTLIRKAKES